METKSIDDNKINENSKSALNLNSSKAKPKKFSNRFIVVMSVLVSVLVYLLVLNLFDLLKITF